MKYANHDWRDTMSGEQNIDRGGVEVEGHFSKVRFEPEQAVEGQSLRVRGGKSDSDAPENTDLSDTDATDESEVVGQADKIRKPAEDVEGQGFRWGKTDSDPPESTDVNDSTDEPEVEGRVVKYK